MRFVAAFALSLAFAGPALGAPRAADLLPALQAALVAQGAPADAVVSLADPNLIVADGAVIDSLSFNPQSGRFVARASGAVIAGAARTAAEVLVLIEPVARGEEIRADNVTLMQTSDALPADVLLMPDEVEGKEARRNLAAGAPLRRIDVVSPILVKRNAIVSITYERPGVLLTQAGVAQGSGVQGDVIDIQTPGGRVVRAVVTGRDRAAVVTAARHAGLK